MANRWQNVFVMTENAKSQNPFHTVNGVKRHAQIISVDDVSQPGRLGGPDQIVDVNILNPLASEDNGDPKFKPVVEWQIECGLSNVKRAKTPQDRTVNTWWPREED